MEKDIFLRLPQIIGNSKANPPVEPIIPICKTTWWKGVKSGIFPAPIKLSPRVAVWRSSDIYSLISKTQK
jgi:predicted DNA-binding transcriptional regulator AlpA